MIAVMAARPPNRTPRYRPAANAYRPGITPPSPKPRPPDPDPVRRHLAEHSHCQWQSRAVRCVAEASDVVASREGVLRSSCAGHVLAWLRTGARLVRARGL
jgi:hypothetical protein